MEDTGVKMLYLCLSKSLDMEALEQNNLPGEWVGVLEGEDAVNIYYPDKDKVCTDFDGVWDISSHRSRSRSIYK